jgi:hypothetical protein
MNGISTRYETSSFERDIRTRATNGVLNSRDEKTIQKANNNHRFVTAALDLLKTVISAGSTVIVWRVASLLILFTPSHLRI